MRRSSGGSVHHHVVLVGRKVLLRVRLVHVGIVCVARLGWRRRDGAAGHRSKVCVLRAGDKVLALGRDGRGRVAVGDGAIGHLLRGAQMGGGDGGRGTCVHRLDGRRRRLDAALQGNLAGEEVLEGGGDARQVRRRVLARQDRRGPVEHAGERRVGGIGGLVDRVPRGLGTSEDASGQGEGGMGHVRGTRSDKVLVVEGHLGNVAGQVLELGVGVARGALEQGNLDPGVDGRVSHDPVEGVEDVPLHLGEHGGIVEATAHGGELADEGDLVLLVAVLGGNKQGRAADELVMTLVDDATRAVAVEQVDGEEERLGEQLKGGVGLDEKVDEVGTHEPLNLLLNVNRGDVGERLVLRGSVKSWCWPFCRDTHLHLHHVLDHVEEVLVAGLGREDIGHGLLFPAAHHLDVFLGGARIKGGIVGIDKVRVAGDLMGRESHDCGDTSCGRAYTRVRVDIESGRRVLQERRPSRVSGGAFKRAECRRRGSNDDKAGGRHWAGPVEITVLMSV